MYLNTSSNGKILHIIVLYCKQEMTCCALIARYGALLLECDLQAVIDFHQQVPKLPWQKSAASRIREEMSISGIR